MGRADLRLLKNELVRSPWKLLLKAVGSLSAAHI